MVSTLHKWNWIEPPDGDIVHEGRQVASALYFHLSRPSLGAGEGVSSDAAHPAVLQIMAVHGGIPRMILTRLVCKLSQAGSMVPLVA